MAGLRLTAPRASRRRNQSYQTRIFRVNIEASRLRLQSQTYSKSSHAGIELFVGHLVARPLIQFTEQSANRDLEWQKF